MPTPAQLPERQADLKAHHCVTVPELPVVAQAATFNAGGCTAVCDRLDRAPADTRAEPQAVPLPGGNSMSRVGRWGNALVSSAGRGSKTQRDDVDAKGRVRVCRGITSGADSRHQLSDSSLGGLKGARLSMEKVPGHIVIGARVADAIDSSMAALDKALEASGSTTFSAQIFRAIGAPLDEVALDPAHIEYVRKDVASVLLCPETGPIDKGECRTCIRGRLLHQWAMLSGDPAAKVAAWTWRGAPGGIAEDFSDLEGLFPSSDKVAELAAEDLGTDLDGFANYQGT